MLDHLSWFQSTHKLFLSIVRAINGFRYLNEPTAESIRVSGCFISISICKYTSLYSTMETIVTR